MSEPDPRPCHVPEPKRCTVANCRGDALSFRDKCWRHLSIDERREFTEEIIRRAGLESLREASLSSIDLQEAILVNADLRQAKMAGANLRDADLMDANLQGAAMMYANLRETDLMDSNLEEADLIGADLRDADLALAHLRKANLQGINLQGARLMATELQGANLAGVLWRGAEYLTAEQVGETGEAISGDWADAEDAYRRLKNYFHEEGRYDDESWAFVREKTCARRAAWQKGIRGKFDSAFSWIWYIFANYGTRWWQAALWAVAIIFGFTLSYWPSPWRWSPSLVRLDYNGPLDLSSFWTSLYFSVVTFATLGFGDIKPANGWGITAVIGEVLCGYVMLGTLVALIARKMTR